MIFKLLIVLLVGFVAAQDYNQFLAKIERDRGFNDDEACSGRDELHFARNSRGCSWFFACNDLNQIISENRCPEGFHFNYAQQNCDYKVNVQCDLDDRWVNLVCPPERGIIVIPHPYTCSKYTGKSDKKRSL